MNSISAEPQQSEVIPKEHLAIVIDGLPLDFLIADEDENGEVNSVELVPTLLSWLTDPKERELTWSRILPKPGSRAMAPILMCPDDCDLICTVVVAEVENSGSEVVWHRIGLDVGRDPEKLATIGREVEWMDVPAYRFKSAEYEQMLDAFRKAL